VGSRALQVKDDLQRAQGLISTVKAQAVSGQFGGIQTTFQQVVPLVRDARAKSDDPIWRVAEAVPVLGKNLTVVRELAALTDDTVTSVTPLVKVASGLTPSNLAPKDGAVPLQPFQEAVPALQTAYSGLSMVDARARQIDATGTIGQVRAAQSKFVGLIDGVVPKLKTASALAPLLPTFLGAGGPRTYVVMFQNNAEVRSLGGTALSFAVISVDHGKITLSNSLSAAGNFPDYASPIIPSPDGFEQIVGGVIGRSVPSSTIRPSFETAAGMIDATWKQKFGQSVDGVVSLDGVALASIVGATGPIKLDVGDTLDASTVTGFLLNGVYARYNTGNVEVDNKLEDAVYADAVAKTFGKLTAGSFDPVKLITGMASGLSSHDIRFWSGHPEEQQLLTDQKVLNDGLPLGTGSSDTVGVYANDYFGSKLAYYLSPSVATSSAICTADERQVDRISLSLTNTLSPTAVKTLSPSIAGNWARAKIPKGSERLLMLVYAPPGATVLSLSVDGAPVALQHLHDTDRPVETAVVLVPAGGTVQLSVDMLMGTPGVRGLEADLSPTVQKAKRTTTPLDCSTVALPK
jgi:hypothetical protein